MSTHEEITDQIFANVPQETVHLGPEKAVHLLTLAIVAMTQKAGGQIELSPDELQAAIDLAPQLKNRFERGVMRFWFEQPQPPSARNL